MSNYLTVVLNMAGYGNEVGGIVHIFFPSLTHNGTGQVEVRNQW